MAKISIKEVLIKEELKKVRLVAVTEQSLNDIFLSGKDIWQSFGLDGIVVNPRIISIHHEIEKQRLLLKIQSPSFSPIEDGCEIPIIILLVERKDEKEEVSEETEAEAADRILLEEMEVARQEIVQGGYRVRPRAVPMAESPFPGNAFRDLMESSGIEDFRNRSIQRETTDELFRERPQAVSFQSNGRRTEDTQIDSDELEAARNTFIEEQEDIIERNRSTLAD